jgi:decaprenylphospho-beta-D-erythro-pentofuranosid-2-ulose 2-reductase
VRDALGEVQSVLVLGGTSEIALATVRALAARRARTVILAGRDRQRLEDAAAEIRAAGAETVETAQYDAADPPAEHRRLVDEVFDRHGDIDLVLVAAGVLGDQATAERDPDAAVSVLRTNFAGLVSAIVPAAERLRGQGHGTLVVLSSVAAERARKSNFVYGSSKAGLDAFAQGLGDSLHGSGVRVMVVRPGFVHTKMTAGLDPAPLSTTADAVANAIVKGLAKGAHTVWVPPQLRLVMSGLRHLPRPLFRRLNV